MGGAPGSVAGAALQAITGAIAGAAAAAVDAAVAATGSIGGTALAAASATLGNQRRNGFRCVMEQIKQRFTLFSPDGVPLRATLTVSLREYKTLEDQLAHLNLSSPDRTHAHVVAQGDALSSIADRYYQRPGEWRAIADENSIYDPRRLASRARPAKFRRWREGETRCRVMTLAQQAPDYGEFYVPRFEVHAAGAALPELSCAT